VHGWGSLAHAGQRAHAPARSQKWAKWAQNRPFTLWQLPARRQRTARGVWRPGRLGRVGPPTCFELTNLSPVRKREKYTRRGLDRGRAPQPPPWGAKIKRLLGRGRRGPGEVPRGASRGRRPRGEAAVFLRTRLTRSLARPARVKGACRAGEGGGGGWRAAPGSGGSAATAPAQSWLSQKRGGGRAAARQWETAAARPLTGAGLVLTAARRQGRGSRDTQGAEASKYQELGACRAQQEGQGPGRPVADRGARRRGRPHEAVLMRPAPGRRARGRAGPAPPTRRACMAGPACSPWGARLRRQVEPRGGPRACWNASGCGWHPPRGLAPQAAPRRASRAGGRAGGRAHALACQGRRHGAFVASSGAGWRRGASQGAEAAPPQAPQAPAESAKLASSGGDKEEQGTGQSARAVPNERARAGPYARRGAATAALGARRRGARMGWSGGGGGKSTEAGAAYTQGAPRPWPRPRGRGRLRVAAGAAGGAGAAARGGGHNPPARSGVGHLVEHLLGRQVPAGGLGGGGGGRGPKAQEGAGAPPHMGAG
jgi:hypothetical protein